MSSKTSFWAMHGRVILKTYSEARYEVVLCDCAVMVSDIKFYANIKVWTCIFAHDPFQEIYYTL